MELAELMATRWNLRKAINDELIEYTGAPRDFIWTDKIIEKDGQTWHEFKVLDTQTLYYAGFDSHGCPVVHTEVEDIFV